MGGCSPYTLAERGLERLVSVLDAQSELNAETGEDGSDHPQGNVQLAQNNGQSDHNELSYNARFPTQQREEI